MLAAALLAEVLAGSVRLAMGGEASSVAAREALAECEEIERMAIPREEKLARFAEGIARTEAVVAAADSDPKAHLALFCHLGHHLELAGLSWRSLGRFRRVRAEIDRAFALGPDDPDVLAARGEALRLMPGPLGGDKKEGERLLRRAIEIQPGHVFARLYLARAIAARGAPDAITEARRAVELAERTGATHAQVEAAALVAQLDP
jgi:tetratricopeptide (TPR) repeat protein